MQNHVLFCFFKEGRVETTDFLVLLKTCLMEDMKPLFEICICIEAFCFETAWFEVWPEKRALAIK